MRKNHSVKNRHDIEITMEQISPLNLVLRKKKFEEI